MFVQASLKHAEAKLPKAETAGAAGLDLKAVGMHTVPAFGRALIPTCLAIAIPEGYAGLVCSRSGLAYKNGIFVLNAPGIIDSDYRGDVGVILANSTPNDFIVADGLRIAQLLIIKHEKVIFELVENLDGTDRGAGGFGSTGVA